MKNPKEKSANKTVGGKKKAGFLKRQKRRREKKRGSRRRNPRKRPSAKGERHQWSGRTQEKQHRKRKKPEKIDGCARIGKGRNVGGGGNHKGGRCTRGDQKRTITLKACIERPRTSQNKKKP